MDWCVANRLVNSVGRRSMVNLFRHAGEKRIPKLMDLVLFSMQFFIEVRAKYVKTKRNSILFQASARLECLSGLLGLTL